MKKLQLIALAASTLAFFSCSKDTDPLLLTPSSSDGSVEVVGSGNVKMGVGIKLTTGGNTNSRILNQRVEINSGYIQVKEIELEVEGENENGEFEKELEYSFPEIKRIDFNQFSSDADFFISIDEGFYEEIEFEVDLVDHDSKPSIYLEGTFERNDGSSIPLRLEVFGDDDDDIDFEIELEGDDEFFFDGSSNPFALMEIDAKRWFSDFSDNLENADLTDGVLVISPNRNSDIYDDILEKIEDSLYIEIELD